MQFVQSPLTLSSQTEHDPPDSQPSKVLGHFVRYLPKNTDVRFPTNSCRKGRVLRVELNHPPNIPIPRRHPAFFQIDQMRGDAHLGGAD